MNTFTQGKIFSPLIKFIIPILAALLLQTTYGAVDLLIVGKFNSSVQVSAVSTGSQVMFALTSMISGLTMGLTILIGQKIGQGKRDDAGKAIGSGIIMFLSFAVMLSIILVIFTKEIATLMHAPEEALDSTVDYLRICGTGMIFIAAYNMIGGIFRGLGDSKTPLMTVAIACVCNIVGDLILVAGFNMAASGAAIATVAAQGISVIISIIVIRKKGLPFNFKKEYIKIHGTLSRQIIRYGAPIALQDILVNLSFLVIMVIGNSMGVVASAGIGVAEKLVGFIMLIPSSFSQALSAFVAQNYGAKEYNRAKIALKYAIGSSLFCGAIMFYIVFFHGNLLSGLFSNDQEVILASWDYMKAYGIDCLLTAIMFSMVGYFNGCGKTTFVMLQGITGAFLVRIPVLLLINGTSDVTLFKIGLATPVSTFVQIILCLGYYIYLQKKIKEGV